MSACNVPKSALLNAMEVLYTGGRCRIMRSNCSQLLSNCVILILQTGYEYYIHIILITYPHT